MAASAGVRLERAVLFWGGRKNGWQPALVPCRRRSGATRTAALYGSCSDRQRATPPRIDRHASHPWCVAGLVKRAWYPCEMRPLRYFINVTLDGCYDHRAIPADEDL